MTPPVNRSGALKILFVTTEAEPFIAVGGLGAVMRSLPEALHKLGCDARVMIPRYLGVEGQKWNLQMEREGLRVPTGNEEPPREIVCNVKRYDPSPGKRDRPSYTVYFLENLEYYEQRANVYEYADDAVRWALLCRGTLEFLKSSSWFPDAIVTTDWQSGILSSILKTYYSHEARLGNIALVHSIHNLAAQANRDYRFVPEAETDDGRSPFPSFADLNTKMINGMKRAIIHSDVINTVSATYAREITTPDYGEGLEQILRAKGDALTGILNGIDYAKWNPRSDKQIAKSFSVEALQKRSINKSALQRRFRLPVSEKFFLMSIVARMDRQKGLDLLEPIMPPLIRALPIQLVVLGTGAPDMMNIFLSLKKAFPKNVATLFKYDSVLPHPVFAGSDVTLIPSRFEPSGLTQMEAMAFGCVPVVRKTGGLADTVEDYDAERQTGTGFVFNDIDSHSLMIALVRAYQSFRHADQWQGLQKRAMRRDFSWVNSAKEYIQLFRRAIALHAKKFKN